MGQDASRSRDPSHPGRRHRRRVRRSRSPQKSASPPRRRGERAKSNPNDRRPWIEREKGGVKLFVGRLPKEVHRQQLQECFEEFGEVLEVFIIASQAQSGVGCAFVRMGSIDGAEQAIADLHEQRVLIAEQRDLGPMQVAFAKGEAIRLGINEKEEILPSFREARQKVEEHKEKKQFFDAMQKQQEFHQQMMDHQQAVAAQQGLMAQQASTFSQKDLVGLIKDGQRNGGPSFKQKWWSYCDQGWAGTRDYDPGHHPQDKLVNFAQMNCMEYGHEAWFRKHFKDLPELPPLPTPPPGMPPPGAPPGLPPPPGFPGGMPPPPGMIAPPGMPPIMPPPFGMPPPGMPPMMPPPGMPPHGMPPMPPPAPGGPGLAPGMPFGPGGPGGPPAPGGQLEDRSQAAKAEESSESESEVGNIEDINTDDI